MYTGEDDISKLGQIDTWNGRKRTAAFPGECGQLTGSTDGLLAPGYLAVRDEFQIWSTDSCRPLTFVR
jgi:CD36 family